MALSLDQSSSIVIHSPIPETRLSDQLYMTNNLDFSIQNTECANKYWLNL